MRTRLFLALLVAAPLLCAPVARAETTCSFGSPTPGFRAVKVNLPNGSEYATIHLTSTRPTMVAGDRSSWHMTVGIGIIDASTGTIVSSRMFSTGSSTRRVVVTSDGMSVVHQDITGPDAGFVHQAWTPVARLDPGTYYLVGFGSDGDRRLPNPWWGAEIALSETVPCTPVGDGETFDFDHTDFSGGTQLSASVAGIAQDATLSFTTPRHFVFGVMDAETQLAGDATLDYIFPGARSGTVQDQIVPFVSTSGEHSFKANFTAPFPVVTIAGVALDVP